jgi:site-specific recombinase XerD
VERKLSPNSLTGYCSGLRFFYNETLGWDENKLFIPPRKKPSILPEVFSPDEVMRLIGAARGLKQRVLLMTAYSAGLRVSELVNLKITDIDAARMTLRVKQGKGGKDRHAILSQKLLTELRQYWKRYRPSVWLFPNRAKNGPLSRGEAWHIFRSAKKRAGLNKGPWDSQPSCLLRHASFGGGCGLALDPVFDGAHLASFHPALLEATATERRLCRESSRQAPVIDGLSHAGRLSAAGSS